MRYSCVLLETRIVAEMRCGEEEKKEEETISSEMMGVHRISITADTHYNAVAPPPCGPTAVSGGRCFVEHPHLSSPRPVRYKTAATTLGKELARKKSIQRFHCISPTSEHDHFK